MPKQNKEIIKEPKLEVGEVVTEDLLSEEVKVEIEKSFDDNKLYTIKVVKDNATIRPLPNHVVNRSGKVAVNTVFDNCKKVEGSLVANSNIWYKVKLGNRDGYIHSSYVTIQ